MTLHPTTLLLINSAATTALGLPISFGLETKAQNFKAPNNVNYDGGVGEGEWGEQQQQ